ncbi:MAG: hydroxyacylglutathione hydrolase [Candidatus Pacebacteria bacterium]|nr:hydroxyacylglutathione hydrolase [Candidatus Paceibacterota bacterium]
MITITAVPILEDNYAWLVHDSVKRLTAVVDPGEAEPIAAVIDRDFGGRLEVILNTHHHSDHTGGNLALKARYGSKIFGFGADSARLPGLDYGFVIGERLYFGREEFTVLDCRGHTSGHIGFYSRLSEGLFCGDALFSLGCGRLFEGTAAEAWQTMIRLRDYAAITRVCCGHEYTASNGVFAQFVDPDNKALRLRLAEVSRLRAQGLATVPSRIIEERQINPFLRADDGDFARRIVPRLAQIGVELLPSDLDDPVAVFAALRRAKDVFKP